MKYLIPLILSISLSFNVNAGSIMNASNDIQSKSTMDIKCKSFFYHYMKFLNSGEFSSAEALMLLLDDEAPGLVDFCDARRSKYIN